MSSSENAAYAPNLHALADALAQSVAAPEPQPVPVTREEISSFVARLKTRKSATRKTKTPTPDAAQPHQPRVQKPRRVGTAFVSDKHTRGTVLCKRRKGLLSKARALASLTGVNVAVLIIDDHGRLASFATPALASLVRAPCVGEITRRAIRDEADKSDSE